MNTTSSVSTVPRKCLSCEAELAIPIVCEGCHRLYPAPQSVDHFALLGLPRSYDVDPAVLQERFLALSRHIHPDYFTGANEAMQSLATRLSAQVNEAVQVLKDPILRASYLLETAGGPSAAENRTVPQEVLGDAMMLREEIDEARADGRSADLDEARRTVETKQAALLREIADLARKLPNASDAERVALREKLNAIKYYQNLLDLLWQ